jgi:hypothetical protein
MLEQYREMENSLHVVSSCIERTGRILSMSGSAAPETYLSATRAIRALQEAWTLHLDIERVLFPRMLCRNLLSGEILKRTLEVNHAIEKQLEAILSAPWPRSLQSGLQSLRIGLRQILSQLRIQIESEQAWILSAYPGVDRRIPVTEGVGSEGRELVAI